MDDRVAGYHVRAMRTAMSSAGLGASAASRVSQAWLTGRGLVAWRVRARRAMGGPRSAAGLAVGPSGYKTRVRCRGTCRGGGREGPRLSAARRGEPGGGVGEG